MLSRLRAIGVRISLDDFGTGHSSLLHLKHLPIHELKIDRSFVHGVCHNPADAAIVNAIADLGHRLGLDVVAEGVEDAETLAVITAAGCDRVQGFHFSCPLPPPMLRWAHERVLTLSESLEPIAPAATATSTPMAPAGCGDEHATADRSRRRPGSCAGWRQHGYPVPAVHDATGADIVMDRVDGSTMLDDVARHPWRLLAHARTLAELHRRLGAIPPPPWLGPSAFGDGAVVHLDLHPLNVLLGPDGPVVIDWANARRGDPAAEVASTWLITATSTVDSRAARLGRSAFLRAFLRRVDVGEARRWLAAMAEHRKADRNVLAEERARIDQLVAREAAPNVAEMTAADLTAAAEAVDLGQRVVDAAIAALGAPGALDDNQVLAYDVAHAAAAVETARAHARLRRQGRAGSADHLRVRRRCHR